eukprot:4687-Heterococcus_DN1.PRE.3
MTKNSKLELPACHCVQYTSHNDDDYRAVEVTVDSTRSVAYLASFCDICMGGHVHIVCSVQQADVRAVLIACITANPSVIHVKMIDSLCCQTALSSDWQQWQFVHIDTLIAQQQHTATQLL